MNAFEYLKALPVLPVTLKRGEGKEVYARPSSSEVRRWLRNGSIVINGRRPQPFDEITFPVHALVFFGKKRKTTVISKDDVQVIYDDTN